jgi:Cys-tRNA(Pro)/Cys-tRNA(Cys) deacylase
MTPAVEAAKGAGIEFALHEYEGVDVDDGDYALGVAAALGRPPGQLFKTLVVSVDGDLRLYIVPADRQLDLHSVGKRAKLAERQQAERATGYVAGGISPLGQRRKLPTVVDPSALDWETILVSAGRRGLQLELRPQDLIALTAATVQPRQDPVPGTDTSV